MRQNRINDLTTEKAQDRERCDQMAAAQTTAQKDIGQLRAQNEQLRQEVAQLRRDLLAAKATPRPTGPPSVSSETSSHSGMADQERIRQLTADANRIRGVREALRRDNAKLGAANDEWKTNARKEKLITDTTINGLVSRLQVAENTVKQLQESSSSALPSHQEMGGHQLRLSAPEGRTSLPATSGESRVSLVEPPAAAPSSHRGANDSCRASQDMPPHLTHETAQAPRDQDEAMESEPSADSGSEEQ